MTWIVLCINKLLPILFVSLSVHTVWVGVGGGGGCIPASVPGPFGGGGDLPSSPVTVPVQSPVQGPVRGTPARTEGTPQQDSRYTHDRIGYPKIQDRRYPRGQDEWSLATRLLRSLMKTFLFKHGISIVFSIKFSLNFGNRRLITRESKINSIKYCL